MADFELVLTVKGGPSRRYKVKPEGLHVGRHVDNDVVLTSQLASRRHARVWFERDVLWVRDLDSSNGIEVNGRVVKEAALHEGDTLLVGGHLFRVARSTESSLGRTVIGPEDADEIHEAMVSDTRGARLPVLYRAARLLGTVFDVDELLRQILELIFEALPVRRGFILTLDPAGGEPRIRAAMSKEKEGEDTPLSHTLIEHVIGHREAILTINAQDDSRFDRAESIVGHRIHAAMCAPLLGRDKVVGALYVDSGEQATPFPKGDLELLTTIARVVGVAVENAQLYQENVQRERLAAIGEATAGLGHCVKNILTGIRGGAELITRAIEKEDIGLIQRSWTILSLSFERIDLLVQNLLTFSRPTIHERHSTDMSSLVREVLGVVQPRADRHKVALVFEPAEDVRCPADGRQIYRAVLNLVTNAVEACERSGGVVTVLCGADERQCEIRVEDTGPGVPAEVLPRLAEAFASTKGSAGTGLGLACTAKIVEEHGGRLEVESEEGQGAAFIIYLPMGDAPIEPPDDAARPNEQLRRTITTQPEPSLGDH